MNVGLSHHFSFGRSIYLLLIGVYTYTDLGMRIFLFLFIYCI
jgi:hypothetical protein